MEITVAEMMGFGPCSDYPESRVVELWAGRDTLTPIEIAALDIPVDARSWALSQLLGLHDPTRVVARRIVRDVLGEREISPEYTAWLDSGDEALRDSARAAYWAARLAADWVAARTADSAARTADWVADGAADGAAYWAAASATGAAAREKYLGWMVEFLEGLT